MHNRTNHECIRIRHVYKCSIGKYEFGENNIFRFNEFFNKNILYATFLTFC